MQQKIVDFLFSCGTKKCDCGSLQSPAGLKSWQFIYPGTLYHYCNAASGRFMFLFKFDSLKHGPDCIFLAFSQNVLPRLYFLYIFDCFAIIYNYLDCLSRPTLKMLNLSCLLNRRIGHWFYIYSYFIDDSWHCTSLVTSTVFTLPL